MKSICFLLIAVLFTACAKDDNCTDHTIGTYAGTLDTDTNKHSQGEITITKAASGVDSLVIQDGLIDPGGVTYAGTLSTDCKTISVPLQTIDNGGLIFTIIGSFQMDGASMTGICTAVDLGGSTMLNYALTKK